MSGLKWLGEYKVDYDDSTSDYISLNDIDGVEVILQDWLSCI